MADVPIEHDENVVEIPVTVKTPPAHRRILIERTELVQAAFNQLLDDEQAGRE